MKYCTVVLVWFVMLQAVCSLDILVCVPCHSRSHYSSFSKLFDSLARKGHNLTVISYHPQKHALPNYRDVDIGNLDVIMNFLATSVDIKKFKKTRFSPYRSLNNAIEYGLFSCNMFLKSLPVKNFLEEENKFDLIIMEDFFSECLWPIVHRYRTPLVRFVTTTLFPWNGRLLANPLATSYIPNIYKTQDDKMTFLDRLENTLANLYLILIFVYSIVPTQMEIANKHFNVDDNTFDNRQTNVSLVLLNTHYAFQGPRPMVPNLIEVGGIHIGEAQKLPKNIEKWINDSKHGVIYFCLGSVVKGNTIPEEKRLAFINAFKRLPQRVIWKWESDTMEDKTDNILIGKWLPQFDILSHPNVKAFISHGGLLGTMEAVHCGVPMVVMPQFGDQHTNAKSLENNGGGVILYMDDANEETIYQSLKKILEPSFQAGAKQLSERFRDRPMPPLETAIYWVEYVARHKGAHFMKTAAVNMPFYQYYLLDVIAFIIFMTFLILFVVYASLRFFFRKMKNLFSNSVKQKKS